MNTRREFLAASATTMLAPAAVPDRISFAQWSINRSYRAGVWKTLEVPRIIKDKLGIDALEFVNQFFENPTLNYLRKVKKSCADAGVTPVQIMVDEEDPTAGTDERERRASAAAHHKYIDMAHYLGCQMVRCNMRGGPQTNWQQDTGLLDRAAESFRDILAYAKGSGVAVVIENHGGASSDPDILAALMKKVNDPQFGMLVDLGNWNKGDDQYACIAKVLPWAKGISVKDIPGWDLPKKLRMCMDSGFHGFWGIESGARTPEGASPQQIFEAECAAVLKVKGVLEQVVLRKA